MKPGRLYRYSKRTRNGTKAFGPSRCAVGAGAVSMALSGSTSKSSFKPPDRWRGRRCPRSATEFAPPAVMKCRRSFSFSAGSANRRLDPSSKRATSSRASASAGGTETVLDEHPFRYLQRSVRRLGPDRVAGTVSCTRRSAEIKAWLVRIRTQKNGRKGRVHLICGRSRTNVLTWRASIIQ